MFKMKRSIFVNVVVLGLVLSIGGLGCKRGNKQITPIPGTSAQILNPPPTTFSNPPVGPGTGVNPGGIPGSQNLAATTNGIPLAGLTDFEGRPANREVFKAYTVYFEFDRSTVKPSEMSKVQAVADYLKKGPAGNDLLIEGHCDERGTEEYNRALGERRALALREALVNMGVGAEKIRTISYGKDRPVDPGHDDSAWSKNRRGEFVLLLPKTTP